jgi:S1-C subfamily serine protease
LPATTRGVIITDTVRSGPADQTGLQSAAVSSQGNLANASFDVVTAVSGSSIKGMNDLISFLARETVPGQTVTLTVLRNGSQTLDLPVTLSSRP